MTNPKNNLVHEYIDLITLGTAADIVPLTDENRIIVKHGLKILSKTKSSRSIFPYRRSLCFLGQKSQKIWKFLWPKNKTVNT